MQIQQELGTVRRPLSLSLLQSSMVLFYEEGGRLLCSVAKTKSLSAAHRSNPAGLRDAALVLIGPAFRPGEPSTTVVGCGDPWSLVMDLLERECCRGRDLHGTYRNHFQAWAVIQEELDEFWTSVHANKPDPEEILQVAATSVRVLAELSSDWRWDILMDGVRIRAEKPVQSSIPEFTSFMDFYAHLTRCLEEYRVGVFGSHNGGAVLTHPLMDATTYCIRALVCGVGTPVLLG